jgi:DNA topoisomerase IB
VGLFRIGGDRYAEENGSYGLMTLQRDHIHCAGTATARRSASRWTRLGAGVRPGWPATQGGFEAAAIRLLYD